MQSVFINFPKSKNVKMSEAKLTIEIKNTKPVEITDFTDAFESLGNQYYKFLAESPYFELSKETKLYVKEIRSGSIITELSDFSACNNTICRVLELCN